MDWFFDKYGRDMVIMDYLNRYQGGFPKLYNYILSQRSNGYEGLNDLILAVFEAGIAFSRATKRDARPINTVIEELVNEQIG